MVSMVTMHLSLLSWRVFFEQAERRRIRSVFAKMVSPKIVNELLASETLSLGGSRREISVLFADVRGFTEWTDRGREEVTAKIRAERLEGAALRPATMSRPRGFDHNQPILGVGR
jgi:adenylate cyclase